MVKKLTKVLVSTVSGVLAMAANSNGATPWDVADIGVPSKEVTITTSEGTWLSVDVSPDGQMLVFDLLGDIYTLPVTGGKATLVRGGPAMERQPRFSPDGSKLLFISDKSGADNLWISDLQGSNDRQVSQETVHKVTNPSWSSDGQYIAASRFKTQGPGQHGSSIGLFHIGGGNGRPLVDAPATMKAVNEPVFGPNGKYLFYTENISLQMLPWDANQLNYAVKRMDLATGDIEQIIDGFGSATTPQVSPDGKKIAFIRRVKDKTALFVYDRESGQQTPVFDGLARDGHIGIGQYGYYPQFSWFPDNRSVAIWGKGKLLKVDTKTANVADIPFTATATHKITDVTRFRHELVPDQFNVQGINQVTTSPDGKTLVFSALGYLWKKSLPDGKPLRLTKNAEFEYEPSFSPDGKRILYVTWDDEKGGSIKVVSASGGKGKIIFTSTAVLRTPSWSPDQEKVAYFVNQPTDIMGGYRVKQGVYWVSAKGGKATRLGDGEYPSFSNDGERIYFAHKQGMMTAISNTLKSVRLNGLDERTHVQSPYARDFRISPDGNWLAFTQHFNLYVVPYKETGKTINVLMASPDTLVARATKHAGWSAHWSADSKQLNWMLGDEYYSSPLDGLFPYRTGKKKAELPEHGVVIGLTAASDKPAGAIAFTNARIITMEGDQVIEKGTVVVEGNRIVSVGRDASVPANAKVIDLSGKTVMPGLIDMHGHLTLYRGGLAPQKHPSYYAAAAFGVTTNFDPSSEDHNTATSTELLRAGRMVGPRYIGTGTIVHGPDSGGHVPIQNVDDARSVMRRKAELGFKTIKSYMQPMRQQRQQLIKAAHENKIMVMPEGELHFYNQLSMILDGHNTIEHNSPIGVLYDDVLQLLEKGNTALTPTLVVTSGESFGENYFYQTTKPWLDPKVKSFVQQTLSMYSPVTPTPSQPPWVRGMRSIKSDNSLWEIGFREAARSLKKASERGVLVNTGAHGQLQGLAMHWEMWMFAQGGMSPMEVLRTATVNPATTLGLVDQIGSIKVGKLADLVVMDGNPLEDIRNTNTITHTMINGRLYDAFTMNEVGNYDRPRTKFYWELPDYNGIDWNETYSGSDTTTFKEGMADHKH